MSDRKFVRGASTLDLNAKTAKVSKERRQVSELVDRDSSVTEQVHFGRGGRNAPNGHGQRGCKERDCVMPARLPSLALRANMCVGRGVDRSQSD